MSNNRLMGKKIVITGASSGVGEQIAYHAAELGAIPILLARSDDKLEAIARTIKKKYNISCLYFHFDVSDIKAVESTFEEIFKQVQHIDILVNNAGFGVFNHVIDASFDEMKSMFEVNVFGTIACTKMVLPKMITRNQGHIINIGSQAGKLATPKSSIYSATKHAVVGFTNSLRMELADKNIYVTAVNPGPIKTRFFDIADPTGNYEKNVGKHLLRPENVARKIIAIMLTRKREINLPSWMNVGSVFYQLFPNIVEKIGGKAFYKK